MLDGFVATVATMLAKAARILACNSKDRSVLHFLSALVCVGGLSPDVAPTERVEASV